MNNKLYENILSAIETGLSQALNERFESRQTRDLLRSSMQQDFQWFLELYGRIWKDTDPTGRAGICFDQLVPDEDYVIINLPKHIKVDNPFNIEDETTYKNRFIFNWPITIELTESIRKVLHERWDSYIPAMLNSGIALVQRMASMAKWYEQNRPLDLAPFYDMLSMYIQERQDIESKKNNQMWAFFGGGKDPESNQQEKAKKFCKHLSRCGMGGIRKMLPVIWLPEHIMVLTPNGVSKCSDKMYVNGKKHAEHIADEWEEIPNPGIHQKWFNDFARHNYGLKDVRKYLENIDPNDPQAKQYEKAAQEIVANIKHQVAQAIRDKKATKADMRTMLELLRDKKQLTDKEKRMLAYLEKKLKK